jgi:hypothetical protein
MCSLLCFSRSQFQTLAKKFHPEIPKHASVYSNLREIIQGNPSHNTTEGVVAGALAGVAVFGGALALSAPCSRMLYNKFCVVPGTKTTQRISSMFGLINDVSPGIVCFAIPTAIAIPTATAVKVFMDGPGRFEDWDKKYNPFDITMVK